MAVVKLEKIIGAIEPDWDVTPQENPPGNSLAHKLRYIMEDSRSIFGQSVYSTKTSKNNRWKSLVHSDYIDPREQPRSNSAPDKMFMSWKVPDRLTTGEPSRASSRVSRSCNGPKKPISNEIMPPVLPTIEQPAHRATPRTAHVPATPRINTGAARLSSRQETQMKPGRLSAKQVAETKPDRLSARNNMEVKPQQMEIPMSARLEGNRKSQKTVPMSARKPKSFKITELLDRYYRPSHSAEDWLANALDADRHMVERVLRIMDKERVTKIETMKAMDNWLKNASERDRSVALDFFQSISGEGDKMKQIVTYLQRGHPHPGLVLPPEMMPKPGQEDKFRYLRLLTPETRKKKWMHQTWHHLPSYRDDNPVNNRSAIYTEPHKLIPRHFTIHPDWG